MTSIAAIEETVAKGFNLQSGQLRRRCRRRSVARPRQIAMYLARTMTSRSYPEIARYFCGFDHTTVIHGCRRIEFLMTRDDDLAERVEGFRILLLQTAQTPFSIRYRQQMNAAESIGVGLRGVIAYAEDV